MKFTLFLFLFLGFSASAQLTATLNDVLVPMRDGEFLEADVYIPVGIDSAEVILIQTPYNKESFANSLPMGVHLNLNSQPFIWVIVDWRGFYGSSGADLSNFTRGEDGYDVCEWISQQIWHKDRIGTWGPSALGGVQYATAREQHPNHTCAVPLVAHPHTAYDEYYYGGVYERARVETLDLLGYGLSPVVLANPYYSLAWQVVEFDTWYPEEIVIPTLQIGGWYDHNINKMMDWYAATRNQAAASVQDQQWLLVGPWVHGGTGPAYVGSSAQGELSYPNAEFVSDTMAWDFFEYYLLDIANGWESTDLITYYETGKDVWATSNSTGIEITNDQVLYLNGNLLDPEIGQQNASFISNPFDPSPTIGGANLHLSLTQGPLDQSSLESRSDVISYRSFELSNDVQISGRVTATIYVESDQPDCDIVVRLADEYPDGRSMLITDGIRRMRFRNGFTSTDESFMSPGNVYEVEVSLPFTNYTWKAGHRIKAYVSGNSSYRWDVNLQNGGAMYVAGDTNIANIRIHQSNTYPSAIHLPANGTTLSTFEQVNANLLISPNPTGSCFEFIEKGVSGIRITDISGNDVVFENNNGKIIISQLEPGIYVVFGEFQGTPFSTRVLKY